MRFQFASRTVLLWLAVALMAFTSGVPARAESAWLKGSWMMAINTPAGTLPFPATFRANGRGTIDFGGDSLPMVYREDGFAFSLSFEIPGELSPNGQDFSTVIRGTRTSESSLRGTAILITETPDPSSPIQVVAATGAVTGQRQ